MRRGTATTPAPLTPPSLVRSRTPDRAAGREDTTTIPTNFLAPEHRSTVTTPAGISVYATADPRPTRSDPQADRLAAADFARAIAAASTLSGSATVRGRHDVGDYLAADQRTLPDHPARQARAPGHRLGRRGRGRVTTGRLFGSPKAARPPRKLPADLPKAARDLQPLRDVSPAQHTRSAVSVVTNLPATSGRTGICGRLRPRLAVVRRPGTIWHIGPNRRSDRAYPCMHPTTWRQ